MENDLLNNKFVNAFINEYDAYLYAHPEVRQNAGLILYKPQNSRSKLNIDKHSFNNEEKLLLISIIPGKNSPRLIYNIHYAEIINSTIPSITGEYLSEQWNDLIGDPNVSHPKIIYRILQSRNIPDNVLIPLLIKIGVSREVCQDKDLQESDFLSKYDGLLWLSPALSDADYNEAICKLLSLTILSNLNSIIPETTHSIADYNDEAIVELAMMFCVLKAKYSLEYEQFLKCDPNEIKKLNIPPISLLHQISRIDQYPELIYEPIFESAHKNSFMKSRGANEFIISTGAEIPVFKEAYEHFCSQNGINPKPEILAVRNIQNQVNPREEFIEKYQRCYKDKKNELSLELELKKDGEAVYDLYNVLKDGYIDASQTTLEQFCYAITGRMRPNIIKPIEWMASINDFAILLNILYGKRQNPQSKIRNIFKGIRHELISSRCTRVNEKYNLTFSNRIRKALNS